MKYVPTRASAVLKRILPLPIVLAIQKIRFTNRMKNGTSDYEIEMQVIKRIVHSGDIVLDIGASLGWYTRYLSDLVGKQGQVISIEPVPYNFEILSYMKRKLRLENVKVIRCAISDSESIVKMHVPLNNSGEPDTYLAHIVDKTPSDSRSVIEIGTTTIDNLVPGGQERIRFIKCDVEGHELSVLKGAENILARCKPVWMLEVWGDPDDKFERAGQTFNILESFDYNAFVFDGRSLHRRRMGEKSPNSNYFFFIKSHLEMVKDILQSS